MKLKNNMTLGEHYFHLKAWASMSLEERQAWEDSAWADLEFQGGPLNVSGLLSRWFEAHPQAAVWDGSARELKEQVETDFSICRIGHDLMDSVARGWGSRRFVNGTVIYRMDRSRFTPS